MDYNKLIKGIIKAARQNPAIHIAHTEKAFGNAKLTTTLRLEVKVSKILSEANSEHAVNSTKFVLLRIED